MEKITIYATGMHCRACEVLLQKSIAKVDEVKEVRAHQKTGKIEIFYEEEKPDQWKIEEAIKEHGYTIGKPGSLPWMTKDSDDYLEIWAVAILLVFLTLILKEAGFSLGEIGSVSSPTLSIAFLVGLTAGISSCMALVGGLILGISAKWSRENQDATRWSRFEPHVYFNIGRVAGFGILGGLLGFFGSFLSLSNLFLGAMTLLVGGVMILLGFNLTNLSPKLGSISITLPKFLSKNVDSEKSVPTKSGTMLAGMLSFFLPCGFTLAMQMYAISTGSFVTGALTMAFFALGTAPWLLGIGGLSSVLQGGWAKRFFKFTGVIVLALWFYNVSNGYTLLSLGSISTPVPVDASNLEVQEIRMVQSASGYTPNVINIKPNKRIRLIIEGKNPYACSSQIMIPGAGVTKSLKAGENIVEFVSPKSGTLKFSCSMGMYPGKFIVDESTGITGAAPAQNAPDIARKTAVSNTKKENTVSSNTETIQLSYDANGLSEQNITLKKGKTYRIAIDVKKTIRGCMHGILIPWLDENVQELNQGNAVEFTVAPTESGEYPITCPMGVPHGIIHVE